MTAPTAFYALRADIVHHPWSCVAASALQACRHCSCKEGSAGFIMPQDVLKVRFLVQTSWRPAEDRGNHDCEPSATHDGERAVWKCLVNSHRTIEPAVPPSETWSMHLVMPAQPAPGECRHKCKCKEVTKGDWINNKDFDEPSNHMFLLLYDCL